MEDVAIGIDLGTTNSAAAVYLNNMEDKKLRILENKEGKRVTPSVVYFFDDLLVTEKNVALVGKYAKQMALQKPKYSVSEIKRLIGRNIKQRQVQDSLRYWPFKVDCTDDNAYVIIEHSKKRSIKKTPVEISQIILEKIKNDVEDKLGASVNKAVITVPAYFNVDQREATLKAATEAGFTVLKLLNEPTAAALSYYYQFQSQEESYSLVYDLGGGTFDVAVLKRSSNNINIISVDGDSFLGGCNFDNLIIDYVCDKLLKEYNFDPVDKKKIMRRLRNECEDAKEHLSFVEETLINLIGFSQNDKLISIKLTRSDFEKMIDTYLKKTITIVGNCLKNAKLSKGDIKEVILSGGSTRIPKIQKMLSEFFEGKALNKFLNPDECVAEGAAIQAALLSKDPKQKIGYISIEDVISSSLGILTQGNLMNFVIRRNTKIPVSGKDMFYAPMDKQKSVKIEIYEGERSNAKKNRFIGTFTIDNLTPAAPGECKIIVHMTIDNNGILTVTAEEQYEDNSKTLKVSLARGYSNNDEDLNEIKSIEELFEEDQRFEKFAKKVRYLLEYCTNFSYNVREKENYLMVLYKKSYDLCEKFEEEAVTFVDVQDEERVDHMIKAIREECEPIVENEEFECMPIDYSQ